MQKRLRGAPSTLVKNKGKGGNIMFRLPRDKHRDFAKWCAANNVSMNKVLGDCVDRILESTKI